MSTLSIIVYPEPKIVPGLKNHLVIICRINYMNEHINLLPGLRLYFLKSVRLLMFIDSSQGPK